jgi:hypothetical protein
MFQTTGVEIKHTFLRSKLIFFLNRVDYEIKLKNIVQPGRPQMTIRHMRCACWIPKTTNTHSEYILLITFPWQQCLHERASMSPYTHTACLVESNTVYMNIQ